MATAGFADAKDLPVCVPTSPEDYACSRLEGRYKNIVVRNAVLCATRLVWPSGRGR
jgi:hypothetical protein